MLGAPPERTTRSATKESDRSFPGASDLRNQLHYPASKVAMLLISANFMASDFIQDKKLPKLIAGAERGGLTLFPLLIGLCAYAEDARLGRYQAVHDVGRPLHQLSNGEQDQVFDDSSRKLKKFLTAPSASES
jgi:hypothetical protein